VTVCFDLRFLFRSGRQLVDSQQAVYSSAFNRERFMVEVPPEELKRREEAHILEKLQKRFEKIEVKIVRKEATKGVHKRGVSEIDVQRYLDKHYNMEVPLEYIQLAPDAKSGKKSKAFHGFGDIACMMQVAGHEVPLKVQVEKFRDRKELADEAALDSATE
jgi:hypothetical protein